MATRVSANVSVQAFALGAAADGLRLEFPDATIGPLAGNAGETRWTMGGAQFTGLGARLRTGHWQAERGKVQQLSLRAPGEAVTIDIAEIELPDGAMIARSPEGIELLAPTALLRGLTIVSRGGVSAPTTPISIDEPAPTPGSIEVTPLKQRRLRFLDAMQGQLALTVKVELDLPVLGKRTLDQKLKIPIKDGTLDFRALDKSLDWLEGTFLDIGLIDDDRLAVSWGVPIVAPQREILSWALDEDAAMLAKMNRVPLRSLADFRTKAGKADRKSGKVDSKKKGVLRSLAIDDISVQLSLSVPRSLAVGAGGHVLFGGDDAAGILDLSISGCVGDGGRPGKLRGSIGALDMTLAGLALGGAAKVWIDRVHLGDLDPVEVRFEGFGVAGISATIAEVTATNLRLLLGSGDGEPDEPMA